MKSVSLEPRRKLSIPRLLFTILTLAAISYTSLSGLRLYEDVQSAASNSPWFAAYVDVTATPTYGFEQLGSTVTKNAVLSFIVSSKTDPCIPTWGTAFDMDEARENLDLDRRITRLQQQGGNIAISFGGLLNDELALNCQEHDKLRDAYESVITRYDVDTIDLDLEREGLTDTAAGTRRAKAIAELQRDFRAKDKSLAVWLTLPVAPQGLTKDGTDAVALMLAAGVDLAGINLMTMDYGGSRAKNQSMLDASKSALNEAHRQISVLYKQAGINLSSRTVWTKIGATPMIGQNDVIEEVFTLEDAAKFNDFAKSRNVGRMSMWSANRDIQCGENYVDTKIVSDSCSGVKQDRMSFAIALSEGFEGDIRQNAKTVTVEKPEAGIHKEDDPESSPYPIWVERGTYLEGTKVVWHGNVYEAKWWTKGDMPDNPVLQAWETPWQLIGPVLPGEDPIPQPTLPAGTYPAWSGNTEYEVNQRVLYEGIPYQAKWWSKGQSPAATSANLDDSPWAPLTLAEIKEIVEDLEKK